MGRVLFLLAALLLTAPASAASNGLIVKPGETWEFALSKGEPVGARKISASTDPRKGRIRVTLQAMMGTTLTIVSNNPQPYTYTAELIGAAKHVEARSCTLPAGGRLSFENWPQKAQAVRLSNFRPAKSEGSCP